MCLEQKSENLNPPIFETQIIGLILEQNSEFDHYNPLTIFLGIAVLDFLSKLRTPDFELRCQKQVQKIFF